MRILGFQRAYGILFVLVGIISLVDGQRVAIEARDHGNFDAIGPDRYLLALGAVMLVGGMWRLLADTDSPAEHHRAIAAHTTGSIPPLASTLVMLASFAALTPAIGFSLACLLFLTAQFTSLSGWPWWRSVATAAIAALALHATFIWLADVPFPNGYVWDADFSFLIGFVLN
jgi:Tripartite tricarboxylate transporter TctB family